MCSQGAGISFVPEGGKLNFEIHEGNIAKNGLKVDGICGQRTWEKLTA